VVQEGGRRAARDPARALAFEPVQHLQGCGTAKSKGGQHCRALLPPCLPGLVQSEHALPPLGPWPHPPRPSPTRTLPRSPCSAPRTGCPPAATPSPPPPAPPCPRAIAAGIEVGSVLVRAAGSKRSTLQTVAPSDTPLTTTSHTHTHTQTHTHTHTHTHIRTGTHAEEHTHIHVHMNTCAGIHPYTKTHTQ